jgi:hypothetical protein
MSELTIGTDLSELVRTDPSKLVRTELAGSSSVQANPLGSSSLLPLHV